MIEKSSAKLHPITSKTNKLTTIVSNIISPLTSGIFIAGFMTLQLIENPVDALKWFGLTVLLTATPPVTYAVYLVKTGQLTDIHMPKREERLKPLLFTFVWLIISLIILMLVKTPFSMLLLVCVALFQVILLGLITTLWKISFHGATIMSAATVTLLLRSNLAWFIVPLVPLVGWSRVHLRRHTLMQVLAGYVAGIIIALAGLYLINYYFPLTF